MPMIRLCQNGLTHKPFLVAPNFLIAAFYSASRRCALVCWCN